MSLYRTTTISLNRLEYYDCGTEIITIIQRSFDKLMVINIYINNQKLRMFNDIYMSE